jgi:uncharacterized protein (TIGR02453 family)
MLQDYIDFMAELEHNNNKLWFDARKDVYLRCHEEYKAFVEEMLVEMYKIDNALQFLNPRESMFRIYRDARFSRNKDPYKTWMSSAFSPNGKKSDEPGYYFQINSDGGVRVAGGQWMPEPARLKLIRKNIQARPEAMVKLLGDKKIQKYFGELSSEKVSRPPREFAKDDPNIEILKYKGYTFGADVRLSENTYENLKKVLVKYFTELKPLILVLREYNIEIFD